MLKSKRKRLSRLEPIGNILFPRTIVFTLGIVLSVSVAAVSANTAPVSVNRWLEIQQLTDRDSRFDLTLPITSQARVQAVATTPLGKKQVYELAIW
ncbi:MAG: hypothetical protein RBJ76_23510 [Stenomitos frigidus ULC029]